MHLQNHEALHHKVYDLAVREVHQILLHEHLIHAWYMLQQIKLDKNYLEAYIRAFFAIIRALNLISATKLRRALPKK